MRARKGRQVKRLFWVCFNCLSFRALLYLAATLVVSVKTKDSHEIESLLVGRIKKWQLHQPLHG